jgi:hypothetical protein
VRLASAAVLLWAFSAFAQADWENALQRATTLEQCQRVYAKIKAQGLPTAFMRGLSTEAAGCTARAANRTIDELLLPLKAKQSPAFSVGMAAQREFNQAVKKTCSRWEGYYERCCSTCSFTEEPACETQFHLVRSAQVARAIAATPSPGSGEAQSKQLVTDFTAFANKWCELLKAIDVQVDEACAAHVLGELEAATPLRVAPTSCKPPRG